MRADASAAPRADTAGTCGEGNINTGFGLLLNFNTLGAGQHTIQVYVDGSARERRQFTVVVAIVGAPGTDFHGNSAPSGVPLDIAHQAP